MPFSAGPRLDVKSAVTTPSPTKPTPTKRPDFSAFENLMPTHTPSTVKMTGIITDAPSPITYEKTPPMVTVL